MSGLTGPAGPPLPAGTLVVDRAGYDEVGSSEWAFGLTSRLAVVALGAALSREDVEESVRAVLGQR
jgi:hypothetical protein